MIFGLEMEIGSLILRFLLSFSKWISYPFRKIIWRNKVTIPIPPIEDPLFFYSATKLAGMIRNKQIKSEIVIKAYIERIKAVNTILNAIVEERFEQAIEEAKSVDLYLDQADSKLIEQLASTRPLLGVPVTIKESCGVKGMSLTAGFTFLKGNKAKEDGVAVANLKAAGAIPLLVSTTTELCLSIHSQNLITGTTYNPYNTNYTAGGSSSGEGALIGSGSSLIGIGTDLAGSVRIPAMFNCIFGHKPTYGIVSCEGHFPNSSDPRFPNYLTIGPLTRYVEDLKVMMKILPSTDKINFDECVNLSNIKLYFMEDIGYFIGTSSVQIEVKQAVQNVINYLRTNYQMQIENEKFDIRDIVESSICLLADLDDKTEILRDPNNPDVKYSTMGQLFKFIFSKPDVTPENAVGDFFVARSRCFIPKSHVPKHHEKVAALREKMISALKDNGILIMPTFPTSAFRNIESVWNILNAAAFNMTINMLGFPSTQIPIGFDNNNMPIGVQVISAPYQDNICIAVAEELAKQFGGWRPPFGKRICDY